MAWKIDKGILGSFLMLVGVVGVIGGLYFLQTIYGVMLGTLFNQVLTGNLNVSQDTIDFLNTTQSNYFTAAGFVNNGALFAGGLITVAVVALVFGSILTFGNRGKKKSADMGY